MGSDNFGTPGKGLINIKIKISTPGIYTVQWRNKVGHGNNSTESNDSWMRMPDATEFYAVQGDKKLFPHGVCTDHCPEGAGSDGWFKVFLSFTTDWTWASYTSDNEGYHLRAKFDTVGVYNLQISGRSKHHIIDRIIMFHSDVEESSAQNLNLLETYCGDNPYIGYASPKSTKAINFLEPITADAYKEELWETAYSDTALFLTASNTLYTKDDYSFSFQTGYDMDNFYLWLDAIDDQVVTEEDVQFSGQSDYFELYFNPTNTHSSNGMYKVDDKMLRLFVGDEYHIDGNGISDSSDEITIENSISEKGYQMEMILPWSVIMGENKSIVANQAIGFDLLMVDFDTSGVIGKLAWANDTGKDSAFADTRLLGNLILAQGNPTCPGGDGCSTEKKLFIKKVLSEPVIDGKADDWNNFGKHSAQQNIAGSTPDASDFKVNFSVGYDEEFFYILATITDDLPTGMKNASSPYLYDNMELFFNPDNKHNPEGAYGEDGIQIRMNYGEHSHYSGTGVWKGDSQHTGFEYVSTLTDNGYLLEGKIPWEGIFGDMLLVEQGLTFGFDISIGDNDGGSSRQNILGWANDTKEDVGYLDTRVFGFATLADVVSIDDDLNSERIHAYVSNDEYLHIQGIHEESTYQIYSLLGISMQIGMVKSENFKVSVSDLKPGIYIVNIGLYSIPFYL